MTNNNLTFIRALTEEELTQLTPKDKHSQPVNLVVTNKSHYRYKRVGYIFKQRFDNEYKSEPYHEVICKEDGIFIWATSGFAGNDYNTIIDELIRHPYTIVDKVEINIHSNDKFELYFDTYFYRGKEQLCWFRTFEESKEKLSITFSNSITGYNEYYDTPINIGRLIAEKLRDYNLDKSTANISEQPMVTGNKFRNLNF